MVDRDAQGVVNAWQNRRYVTLWGYADETGSVNEFFLVAAFFTPDPEATESAAVALETSSGRHGRKWQDSSHDRRELFLSNAGPLLASITPVYWRRHPQNPGVDQVELAAVTLAEAAFTRDPTAIFRIQVDALKAAEVLPVRRAFTSRGLTCRRIAGGREQTSPLLRLADAMAGFIGDVQKQKPYAQPYWERLREHFRSL